jgi:hypothetical protein
MSVGIFTVDITDPEVPARVSYLHEQTVAAAVWNVQHNMARYPSITVVDSAGDVVFADVEYVSANLIRVTHGGATTGRAFLN